LPFNPALLWTAITKLQADVELLKKRKAK